MTLTPTSRKHFGRARRRYIMPSVFGSQIDIAGQ